MEEGGAGTSWSAVWALSSRIVYIPQVGVTFFLFFFINDVSVNCEYNWMGCGDVGTGSCC